MKSIFFTLILLVVACNSVKVEPNEEASNSVKFEPNAELQITEFELKNYMNSKYENLFLVDHCHVIKKNKNIIYLYITDHFLQKSSEVQKQLVLELIKFFRLRYKINTDSHELEDAHLFVVVKDEAILKALNDEILK